MPPTVSFNMGSLGFLTPFPINEYQAHIKRAFEGETINTCILTLMLCFQGMLV